MATLGVLIDIGRSAREAFFMFWETLWPIILGFGFSGAIQAFLSGRAIERQLGTHRPSAIARSTGYGMASSSCSYAATAMAKSLFVKGADFISVSVFMFASTNLVLELGVILIALIGWQFALSEFIGGLIMIVLLVVSGSFWLRSRSVVRAGELAGRREAPFTSTGEPTARWQRVRTRAGWADAATYTMSDLAMIRKELVIGYGVAGVLAVVIPHSWWHTLFWPGHGIWTTVENVVVGPFIAIVSFVCSIGNVPLAAALWQGGISFGGVISFVFADLITFPLLLIYRRYYGTEMMLRMLAVFWLCMSVAALITEELFRASGLLPSKRPTLIAVTHFSWNYTTYLNLLFLPAFALLYWLYRNRHRFSNPVDYTRDPVCGMRVVPSEAPAMGWHGGQEVFFCSDHCAQRFAEQPDRFSNRSIAPQGGNLQ
jgi:uncharacterized membrane protein YraQ (UPF0718 family)/YHS domain-containing protein